MGQWGLLGRIQGAVAQARTARHLLDFVHLGLWAWAGFGTTRVTIWIQQSGFGDIRDLPREVNVPTLLIHGSTDLGERSLTDTAPLMTGPYRVVRPAGGHFIVDEQPQAVADEIFAHLRAYPLK